MPAALGPELKEKAYQAWRECAQNIEKASSELGKRGTPVSSNAMRRWRDKYGWKERADRADAEEKIRREAGTDDYARLIVDLEAQKARYDRFFESLGDEGIDVKATYAYTALIKTIAEVRKKAASKPDLYAMSPVVMGEFVRLLKAGRLGDPNARTGTGVKEIIFDLIDRFFEEIEPNE